VFFESLESLSCGFIHGLGLNLYSMTDTIGIDI
jgi:hypothetical protein